jgi:hypothetical protein
VTRTNIVVGGIALATSVPPMAYGWWYSLQSREPPLLFYAVLPVLIVVSIGVLAWACRGSTIVMAVAPLLLIGSCIAGTKLSGEIGSRRVLSYCDGLLASPTIAASHTFELEAIASTPGAACAIHDMAWKGTWELGVYSSGRRLGNIELRAERDGSFSIARATIERASR